MRHRRSLHQCLHASLRWCSSPPLFSASAYAPRDHRSCRRPPRRRRAEPAYLCLTPLHGSPPFHFLRKQASYLPLYSPPCYKRQTGPPTASRAAVARHERRRPRPPRGAPSSVLPRPEPPQGTSPSRLTDPPKPAHCRPNPPERRLRREKPPPTAGACGAAASDLLPANQGHPEVRLGLLYLFPTLTLAAGEPGRRKTKHHPSPVLFRPPGTFPEKKQKSRGLDAKVRFLFLLFSKTANL